MLKYPVMNICSKQYFLTDNDNSNLYYTEGRQLSIKNENENSARQRLSLLFDDGSYNEIDAYAKSSDGQCSVVVAYGKVNGECAYAFSQDINSNGGAVNIAQCKKIKKAYNLASKTGCPIIGIYDSNGVDLSEGFGVLGEYCDLVKTSSSVSGVVLQIAVIAGACLGSSAVVANMADIVIQLKDTDFYVAAPSDITAEDCIKQGNVDIIADDFNDAAEYIRKLISLIPSNNLAGVSPLDFESSNTAISDTCNSKEILKALADANSIVEIKNEYADNVITSFASIEGIPAGFIAFNGKPLCPKCAYKAESFIKLCDVYSIPIITLINIDSVNKENEHALLTAMTKLVSAYSSATSPKISVITKSVIGTPYVLFGTRDLSADIVFAWDGAVASPLEVDAAVSFMYNDRLAAGENRGQLEEEYKNKDANVLKAAECGEIDDVFEPSATRKKIAEALDVLSGKRENTIPRKHSVK